MKIQWKAGWVVAIALAAALVGCKRTDQPSGAPPKEVRIGYFANLTHAQAVLGVHSGELAKAVAPAKLVPRIFNAGPSLIEALTAGEIDIAYVGPQPALAAYVRKNESVVVVAGAAANGSVIVARRGTGISKLEDLAGKKIATPQLGNTQDLSARAFVLNTLKRDKSELKNVVPVTNPEQVSLMQRGQIDAAWVPEPWGARLIAEAGATLLAEEKDLWSDKEVTVTVVITTPKFLATHPGVVTKVLEVHRSWTKRLRDEPAAALPQLEEALYKLSGKRLPEGVLPQAFSRTNFTEEVRDATLKTYAQWSYDLGFSKSVGDLSKLVDTRLLKELGKRPTTTR